MNDIVLRLENISKYYRLGVINNGTFRQDLKSWIALKKGKEDPNAKIGSLKDFEAEGFWALSDVSFDIHQGDRVGIIGKNGAGKSTLLKIISGITTPTKGNIKIKGRISSLLEVGTGFNPELTGRENIYLNGAILGMKKKEVDRKIDEIIAFSEIEKHIDTPVKRYSSGMYVRLAFAVAAHLDSDILIADEVLAVGDDAFQKKALGKMNELSSGLGRTVLFVSHNMAQVKNLCNKGIVLEKGRIKEQYNNIEDAISWYLGEINSEVYPKSEWNNYDKFYNTLFTPIEIKILNNKGQVFETPINYNEEFNFYIKYKVEQTGNMDFYLKVNKNLNSLCNYYTNESFKPGIYEKTFYVPKRTFMPGLYTLTLGASDFKEKSWIIDESRRDVSLFFKIYE